MENYLEESEARSPKLILRKIVSVTFDVLAENPGMFLIFAALGVLPGFFGEVFLPDKATRELIALLDGIFTLVFAAAITAAAHAELSGGSVGPGEALRRGLKNYPSLLCVHFLPAISVFLLRTSSFLQRPEVPFLRLFYPWLFKMLLLSAVFFYLVTVMYAAVPACVVEGLSVVKAFRRSFSLTKGYRARICVLLFFYGLAEVLLRRYLESFHMAMPWIFFLLLDILENAVGNIMAVCVYFVLRIKKEHS